VTWFVWESHRDNLSRKQRAFCHWRQLAAILILGLYVINTFYGFEGSFQRLGDFRFVSQSLGGDRERYVSVDWRRNQFAHTHLAAVRVPLPTNYVLGIDVQKRDFERGLPSYLHGRWADRGWWYYYLYALAVKVPLGTWLLLLLALGVTLLGKGYNRSCRDEMVLLAPGVAIVVFVSSQTGFSIHSRYVLPALPFFFVWISKVGRVFLSRPPARGRRLLAAAVIMALTWSVGSSLWGYPHSLSYFNELVGGPTNGGAHLLSSNIDWGQDLFYLKAWLDKHPRVRLDGLALSGSYSATLAGFFQTPFPPVFDMATSSQHAVAESEDAGGPRPGWYALSVNYLYSRDGQYRYFLKCRPVAMAGYSIYIYHITAADVARLRRQPRRAARATTAARSDP